MDGQTTGKRSCPACGGGNYTFRGRKQIDGEQGPMLETKYACRACGHAWKVTEPGVLRKAPPPEP
jgi:hypothetical protein